MKTVRQHCKTLLLALTGCLCSLSAQADSSSSSQTLYPLGSQSTFKGPEHLFSGDVKVDILFPENDHTHFSGAYVHFAPGARTAWHEHPAGQHMIVTKGTALTGTRDGKVIRFGEGETVWCPPNIDHWHGATPHAAMTHLVITGSRDGENVIWKHKVTDDEYRQATQSDDTPIFNALSPADQALVKVSAHTAVGNQTALEKAIHQALDAGMSINAVKEIQVHLYAYTGFPRALNGLVTLMKVLDERKAQGIQDEEGPLPSSIPADQSSQLVGERVQTELVGRPVSGPLFDFAPGMNTFLQSHLFGDIFARGVLDYLQRELVTVAALASLDGTEPQLNAHIRMSTNVGITEVQLSELAAVLTLSLGSTEGQRVEQAVQRVLHAD